MWVVFLVGFGGAIGSLLRYWVQVAVEAWTGPGFPWGTVAINVVGSFVIGAFAALTGAGGRLSDNGDVRVLVMVGLCGGFTTFSSFSLQTLVLLRAGQAGAAAANVVVSVVLSVIATFVGIVLFMRA